MSHKIYPIGIQNFESLRQDGYFYIDKTALMYQMVKTGRYYFLSRPRRFGKSLLVSTLEVPVSLYLIDYQLYMFYKIARVTNVQQKFEKLFPLYLTLL